MKDNGHILKYENILPGIEDKAFSPWEQSSSGTGCTERQGVPTLGDFQRSEPKRTWSDPIIYSDFSRRLNCRDFL